MSEKLDFSFQWIKYEECSKSVGELAVLTGAHSGLDFFFSNFYVVMIYCFLQCGYTSYLVIFRCSPLPP